MIDTSCAQCGSPKKIYPSQLKRSSIFFCNKTCHRQYANSHANPSWTRDVSGTRNPMYGKHPVAWNKGLIGEDSHNWKGGIHIRKDGYVRINVKGKRKLLHRYLLEGKLTDKTVVHHKDHNPSNNDLKNLVVLDSQSTHARLHGLKQI